VELRQLKYFVTVAEELNFTRAAERLHVVQPALSRQITMLEEKIGAPLFNRSRRQIRLTSVGQVFLEEARAAIERTNQAFARARQFAQVKSGRVRVGFTAAALHALLLRFRKALAVHHPEVELEVLELCSLDQEKALANHTIDFGLLHPPIYDARIECRRLWYDPLMLAAQEGHPLTAQKIVSFDQLRDESLIFLPRDQGPYIHDQIVANCTSAGFIPTVVSREMRTPNVLALVAAGVGLAFLPRSVCAQPYFGVRFVSLDATSLGLELALAWNQGDDTDLLKSMRELVCSISQEVEAPSFPSCDP
jgi:DNA-binding transcriptional LysR family regulator